MAHHAPLLSRSQCAGCVQASASFEQLLVASIGHGQRKRGTNPFIGFTTSKAHRPPDDGFATAKQNQGAHSGKGTAEDSALNDLFSPVRVRCRASPQHPPLQFKHSGGGGFARPDECRVSSNFVVEHGMHLPCRLYLHRITSTVIP